MNKKIVVKFREFVIIKTGYSSYSVSQTAYRKGRWSFLLRFLKASCHAVSLFFHKSGIVSTGTM